VAEVGVHLDDGRGFRLVEHAAKAVAIRDPEPFLPGAVQDLDPGVGRCQLVGQLSRAVRGPIIDDQQPRLGQGIEDRRRDAGQVLPLVVGRQDDPDAASGGEANRRGRLRSRGGQRPTPT
jgi:hypothetical protein